jgi:hypothetical protein
MFIEGHRHIVNSAYVDPSSPPTEEEMRIGVGVRRWLPMKMEPRFIGDELVAQITWQVEFEELIQNFHLV